MRRIFLAAATALACAATPERPECADGALLRHTAECKLRIERECGDGETRKRLGMADEDCPAIVECDRVTDEWERCK